MTMLATLDGSSTSTASAEPADSAYGTNPDHRATHELVQSLSHHSRGNPCRPISDRAPGAQRAKPSGVSWRRGFLPSGFDAPQGHAPGHRETTWRPKVASTGRVGLVQRY
jgi:hypothetical protein